MVDLTRCAASHVDDDLFDYLVKMNDRIKAAPSIPSVMEIIFDNFDVASPVNFATAVHSIAKKARGLPGPEQRRITRGTAFRELVSGAARLADEMKPRDLSNVMWALGALRYAPDASAKSIVSVATSRVDDFNTRDLSTALWAVGNMRIRSSDFLTLADDSMAKAMDEASDQDLVMALHAMSQLSHKPGPLLDRCVGRVMEASGPATEWGSPALLSALTKAVAKSGLHREDFWDKMEDALMCEELPTRERVNIFGAMALARHQPRATVAEALMELMCSEQGGATPFDAAQAAHAYATLRGGRREGEGEGEGEGEEGGRGFGGQGALERAVIRHKEEMRGIELGLAAWSLAVAGALEHATTLQSIVDALGRVHARGRLKEDTLRQVMQVLLLCEGAGRPLEVEMGLAQDAVQQWMAAAAGERLGRVTVGVASVAEALGLSCRTKVRTMDGLLVVEVGVKGQGKLVAVEVLHLRSRAANTGAILGSDWAKAGLLRGQGWAVGHVDAEEWKAMKGTERVESVASLLGECGIEVGEEALRVAKSGPEGLRDIWESWDEGAEEEETE